MKPALAAAMLALLGACVEDTTSHPSAPFGQDEVLHFTGTEPFWGGEVRGSRMTYETPDDPEGETVEVTRSATSRGISFAGALHDGRFTMEVWSSGKCSDGMSDRTYPFEVRISFAGGRALQGCGWTARRPYRGEG